MRRGPKPGLLTSLAANVRSRREELGITQEKLAEGAGVDIRSLQRIERGEMDVGVVAFFALAQALRTSADTLLQPASLPPPRRGRPLRRKMSASELVAADPIKASSQVEEKHARTGGPSAKAERKTGRRIPRR
jgi:transcriptional regulator with XRE-family HTH domain